MSRLPHVFKSWRGSHRMKVTNEGFLIGRKVSIICSRIRGTVHVVMLAFRFCKCRYCKDRMIGDRDSWNSTYIGVTHLPRKPGPWQQGFGHQSRINCDQKRRPKGRGENLRKRERPLCLDSSGRSVFLSPPLVNYGTFVHIQLWDFMSVRCHSSHSNGLYIHLLCWSLSSSWASR